MPTVLELSEKDIYSYVASAGGGISVQFPLSEMPAKTLIHAIHRGLNHVFSNESISKASTEKKKKPELTDAEYQAIITAAREKFLADMKAGTWGDGSRGPRMPAENRLAQIFNMLCGEDVRKALATAGKKPGEAKDTWLDSNGEERPLSEWMRAYLDSPQWGAERTAGLNERAKIKHEAEIADAAARKAAREREAKAGSASLEL